MHPHILESPSLSQDLRREPGAFGMHGSWPLNHSSCYLLSSYNCSLSYSKVIQTPPLECPLKSLTQSIYTGNRCCRRSESELNIKHLDCTAGTHPQCSSSEHTHFPISSFEQAVQFCSPLPAEPQSLHCIF